MRNSVLSLLLQRGQASLCPARLQQINTTGQGGKGVGGVGAAFVRADVKLSKETGSVRLLEEQRNIF